jgi:hypothetical protein
MEEVTKFIGDNPLTCFGIFIVLVTLAESIGHIGRRVVYIKDKEEE